MKRDAIVPEEVLESVSARLKEMAPVDPPDISTLGSTPELPINDTYSGSLDDAASLLLKQLTPSIRDYAFEIADLTLHIPRWQLLLGAFMSQYESGQLPAPSIDPSWRRAEIAEFQSICKQCGKTFQPKRYGQVNCSPECGTLARKAEITAINKRKGEELKVRKAVEKIAMGLQP